MIAFLQLTYRYGLLKYIPSPLLFAYDRWAGVKRTGGCLCQHAGCSSA